MGRKLLICLMLFFVFTISGCSKEKVSKTPQKTAISEQPIKSKEIIPPYKDKELSSRPVETDGVVWTPNEVYNIQRFNRFIESTQRGIRDTIRITALTKEGDHIIYDLDYNNKVYILTCDNTSDKFAEKPGITTSEYKELIIQQRYSEHYKGTFTEYLLKNNKDDKEITILQIYNK